MKLHSGLIQGSEAWKEFRAVHFGASEAASAMGLSKQVTRNDLLLFKKTGKSKEYSDWVQKNILDNGHEVEAKVRVLLEKEIEEDLYPVVCSNDDGLSASCDGLTIDGTIAFECKQFNKDLVAYIEANKTLPDTHMPQCQQILLVTGAEEVIFVCSDGTKDKWVMCVVFPDQIWFSRIKLAWEQFKRDLENFVPEEKTEKLLPATMKKMPELSIVVTGDLEITGNLEQFKEEAKICIESMPMKFETDQDFVNAIANVKYCEDIEAALTKAIESIMDKTASLGQTVKTVEGVKEEFRKVRLVFDKTIKSEKARKKNEIIDAACEECERYTTAIHNEFKLLNFDALARNIWLRKDIEAVCAKKSSIEGLNNAAATEVAVIKIKLDEKARLIRTNLSHMPHEETLLFPDLQQIILKSEDDFQLLVTSRLAEQKQKEEAIAQKAIDDVKKATEAAKVVEEVKPATANPAGKPFIPGSTAEVMPFKVVTDANLAGFDKWWSETGGKILPKDNEYMTTFAKRVAQEAWSSAETTVYMRKSNS